MSDPASEKILRERGERQFVVGALQAELNDGEAVDGSETRPCARCERLVWLTDYSLSRDWIPICAECAVMLVDEAARLKKKTLHVGVVPRIPKKSRR